jgi:SM-20-related protein
MLFKNSSTNHSTLTESELYQLDTQGWVLLSAPQISQSLYEYVNAQNAKMKLTPAHIHAENKNSLLHPVRNDFIQWIDSATQQPVEIHWLSYLEQVRLSLKNYFILSLTHVESHFAYYPVHHFYQRHSDQKKIDNCRFFSMVCYLNKDWEDQHGGQLVGYDHEKIIFKINPSFGSIILFKSEIEHEVLISHRDRTSVVAWFRTSL